MVTSAESAEGSVGSGPASRSDAARPAAGIYGLIVTASVLAGVGATMGTAALAVAVFVTLLVYWLSEQYAELGEHVSGGHLPSWAHTRAALLKKWPMVTASYIPLATLLVARLLGAEPSTAAVIALIAITVMLMWYGWNAGRASGLRRGPQLGMTLLAGALGLVMILLKGALGRLHWGHG